MPFFRFPFFYNPSYYTNQHNNSGFHAHIKNSISSIVKENYSSCNDVKKNNSKSNVSDENYFFELFGLKLYFDDVLIICLIFFLYQEGVKDDELFLGLILLLLS